MAKTEEKQGQTVRLALGTAHWRLDAFDPSIEGVPPLGQEYAEIPADKEEAVRQAAKDHGLSVRKEG